MISVGRWFESDAFWRDMEPKIYSAHQWDVAAQEVEAAMRILGVNSPAIVLDMCCGTGRHSIELAKLGHQVTGIDLNKNYLETARKNASEKGCSIEFLQKDMRKFQDKGTFDAALILWNAFGYFETEEEDLASLKCIYTSLRPRGKILIQTHGRESTARKFVSKDWFEIGDCIVFDQRWIERDWSIMRTKYVIIDGKGRREHVMSCRLYSPTEITSLLKRAGFDDIKVHGGLNGSPYDEKAFELVVHASKQP